MMSMDDVQCYIDESVNNLPAEIFDRLNGGVIILPDTVRSPHDDNLYITGTYRCEIPGMGRYITIYYGSLCKIIAHASVTAQKEMLTRVLHHELTHHLESLAGVRDLEYEDAEFIRKYKAGKTHDAM